MAGSSFWPLNWSVVWFSAAICHDQETAAPFS